LLRRRWIFDLELSYTLNNRYTFIAGAQNLFDKFPDKDPNRLSAGNSGNEYTTSSRALGHGRRVLVPALPRRPLRPRTIHAVG
jgi:outer membrane receptor protein involved in Fe transport